MKSYKSNPLYAALCLAGAVYLSWQAYTGQGGWMTVVSAVLVALAGVLFLAAYFKWKKLDQDDPDEKENP